MFEELVFDSYDGDLFGILRLAFPLFEPAPAEGAGLFVFGNGMGDYFDGQIPLRFRPMAFLRRFRRICRLFGVFCRSLLGRRGEETALHRCQLFFEESKLHLRIDGLPPQTGVFCPQFGDLFGLPNGGFFKMRCEDLEGRDVGDFLQPRHDLLSQQDRYLSSI